eukprot:1110793-Prymnesium_polylepis.1
MVASRSMGTAHGLATHSTCMEDVVCASPLRSCTLGGHMGSADASRSRGGKRGIGPSRSATATARESRPRALHFTGTNRKSQLKSLARPRSSTL